MHSNDVMAENALNFFNKPNELYGKMAEDTFFLEVMNHAIDKAGRYLGYDEVKELQRKVISEVVSGRDVFAVLPTGFGKSLCYGCLPLVFDEMINPPQPSIVCVISPLTAIIEDQVRSFSSKGLRTGCVLRGTTIDKLDGVASGFYQLVFFTPESVLNHKRWRNLLRSEVYMERLKVIVIDEAHTVTKWGDTFRRTLSRIGEIKSIVSSEVVFMALTATASKDLRKKASDAIGLVNPTIIAMTPCKKNIVYGVSEFVSIGDTFGPILEELKDRLTTMGRIIIYCRRFNDCTCLYQFFKVGLGQNFTYPNDAPPELSKYRLVEMYTSCTDSDVKTQIVESFSSLSSPLRIVCATVAFGMGVDTPDVRQVIHYGAPNDLHSYIQETGRGGRDGKLTIAKLLIVSKFNRYCDKGMLGYLKNTSKCRRDVLFEDTDNYVHTDMGKMCLCCDICKINCDCGLCENLV